MISPLPKVILRPMEPEDLEFLYNIENDTSLWEVGNTNVPYSRYALHDYIANTSNDIYVDGQVRFMITDAEGVVIGMVDLVNFNPKHCRAELGIVIAKEFRGMGYAQAAVKKVVTYARSTLHLHQLYVIVDKENEQCQQAFRSVDFLMENLLKDWLYDGNDYHDAIFMQRFL